MSHPSASVRSIDLNSIYRLRALAKKNVFAEQGWVPSFVEGRLLNKACVCLQGSEEHEGTPSASAATRAPKTPWRTPAPAFAELATPQTAVAAAGWQELYDDETIKAGEMIFWVLYSCNHRSAVSQPSALSTRHLRRSEMVCWPDLCIPICKAHPVGHALQGWVLASSSPCTECPLAGWPASD